MYKPLPRTAVLDVSRVDGFASAAPAINGPGDNEVRGVVGWSEITMTRTIQITMTRTIKITMTKQIINDNDNDKDNDNRHRHSHHRQHG